MAHVDRHDPYGPRTHFEENPPASPITSIIVLAIIVVAAFGAMALFRNADTGKNPTLTPPVTQQTTPPAMPTPARPGT